MVQKVILIGFGHLGKWHAQKASELEESQLVAVVDPEPTTQEKLKDMGVNCPLYKSLAEVNIEFDSALVVTPTSFHFQICKELIQAGKHVFCEKPMTSTHEEALKIKSLVKENDVIFQVGHSERFHSIWERVRERNDFLGGTPLFQLNRQAPFKGRATDVDVVQDLMIHDIDLLLFLFNEVPTSVKAWGKKMRTHTWDFVQAQFSFSSGAMATIQSGRNHHEEVRELNILNDCGTLHVDLYKKEFKLALSGDPDGRVSCDSYEPRDHLLEEQKAFYQAISRREKAIVDVEDGRKAVYFVDKVLQSLESRVEVKC